MPIKLYCCGCGNDTTPRLTDGEEIYPHRQDLFSLPFWKCDACGNFVGCHHKTKDPTRPLGCIPTPEIKKARQSIHRALDPLWKTYRNGVKRSRRNVYATLSKRLGYQYHTAEVRDTEEAGRVLSIIKEMSEQCHSN